MVESGCRVEPNYSAFSLLIAVDSCRQSCFALLFGGNEIFEKECIPFFQLFGTDLRLYGRKWVPG